MTTATTTYHDDECELKRVVSCLKCNCEERFRAGYKRYSAADLVPTKQPNWWRRLWGIK